MRRAEPPHVTEASLCASHLHAGLATEENELAVVSLNQRRGATWRGHHSRGWRRRRRRGGGLQRSGGSGGGGEGGVGVGGSGVGVGVGVGGDIGGGGGGGGGGGRKRERLEAPRGLRPHQL